MGHTARKQDERWPHRMNNWFQMEGKETEKNKWSDKIVKFLWHRIFHKIVLDRQEWARLREAFVQNYELVINY